jgi:hypothetical protein
MERIYYQQMKENRISTLDLNAVLQEVGVVIPQRTLQHHLDHNLETTIDDRIRQVMNLMIENRKDFITNLKKRMS